MLSEADQRVATLQLGCNCCNFIAIFAALSSAAIKSERAFNLTQGCKRFATASTFTVLPRRYVAEIGSASSVTRFGVIRNA